MGSDLQLDDLYSRFVRNRDRVLHLESDEPSRGVPHEKDDGRQNQVERRDIRRPLNRGAREEADPDDGNGLEQEEGVHLLQREADKDNEGYQEVVQAQ